MPPSTTISLVTAMICTRNRGASLVPTVSSILANAHPRFELIVVDQSTDDRTAAAIRPFQTDVRLRYIRTNSHGLGLAHNLGIAHARGDIVVITDDDCEVPPDWLEKMVAIFDRHPRVAVSFCNVLPVDHDNEAGFIPAFHCQHDRLLTSTRQWVCGIGAGFAVQRQAVLDLGGFDSHLGPGAVFPSGDEQDLAERALLKGYHLGTGVQSELSRVARRTSKLAYISCCPRAGLHGAWACVFNDAGRCGAGERGPGR